MSQQLARPALTRTPTKLVHWAAGSNEGPFAEVPGREERRGTQEACAQLRTSHLEASGPAAGARDLAPTKRPQPLSSSYGEKKCQQRDRGSACTPGPIPSPPPRRRASAYTSPLPHARYWPSRRHRAELEPRAASLTTGTAGHRTPAGWAFKWSICT